MKKTSLMSAVLAIAASMPFSIPCILTQPSVYAQEEMDMPLSVSLEMASTEFSIDKNNETNFFPTRVLSGENKYSLTLLSSNAESDMFGQQIAARFFRGALYQKMGDYVRAREDFRFVVNNEPKDAFPLYQANANIQLMQTNSFNGSVRGTLSEVIEGETRAVTNGMAALFDGYQWTFSIVNDGNFSFLYEQNKLIENTKLPVIFFSEEKEPVYRLLDTNNEATDLGEVILGTSNEKGTSHKIGFAYRLVEEEFNYGIELCPNKQIMFCPGETKDGFEPMLGAKSNEEGFYKFAVQTENFREGSVKEGITLENKKLD
ncbi:hypothetical protein HZA97_06225 [Candidatus Woesearchaeota archaeon]|nr:hypothetical protein [Candidatus Woesearchaeota archaeon]